MKIIALVAIALLTGCASNINTVGARWFVPAQPEALIDQPIAAKAPEQVVTHEKPVEVDALAAIHVELPLEDVAALDALRANDAEKTPHVGGDHVAQALPFDCVVPFAIGICAVAPVSPVADEEQEP